MKKGRRNNIILLSIVSFMILWSASGIIMSDRDEPQTKANQPKTMSPLDEANAQAARLKKRLEQEKRWRKEGRFNLSQKPTAKATNNLSHKSIVYSARYAIRQYLHLPIYGDSFPVWPDNSYGITTLKNNIYLVSGKITAKNVYGVKLQNTWITILKFSGNNLETVRVTYIKIGDEVLLDVP